MASVDGGAEVRRAGAILAICLGSSAGEFLMICTIVLDWVSTNVGEHLPGEVELFRRLCDVIDYIQALKYGIVYFIKAFQTRVRSCVGYVSHACFHR